MTDNEGVNRFARAMRRKLAKKSKEGKEGWNDEYLCTLQYLKKELRKHFKKGDMVDIANFAMMIWNRTRPINRRKT